MNEEIEFELTKNKAYEIVSSCTTCEQLSNAKSYIDLYYTKFGDEPSFKLLTLVYEEKKKEFKCID